MISWVSTIDLFKLKNGRRSFLIVLALITRAHAARALGNEPPKMKVRIPHEHSPLLDAPTDTQFLPEIKVHRDRKHIS